MTKEQAIAKAIEWNEIHDAANAEEEAECHDAAESLRMQAADIEHELRDAGFDAYKLAEDEKRSRR